MRGKLEWKKLYRENWSGWKNWEGEIEAGKSDQEKRSRKTGSGKPEWQNQSEITVAEKLEWKIFDGKISVEKSENFRNR